MAKKVGTLIKEARTNAGLSQEALAKKIKGISAGDLSLAERGEKELTQAVLKEIAKITGVTQKSLIDAAKQSLGTKNTTSSGAKKTASSSTKKTASSSSKKTTSSNANKTASSSSKKTTSSNANKTASSSSKKTTSAGEKKSSSSSSKKTGSSSEFKVSAEEKKMIQAYRGADEKIQTAVKMMLFGTDGLTGLPGHSSGSVGEMLGSGDLLSSLLGSVKNLFG